MNEKIDRSKYRNPSPPPGYVKPKSCLALKSELDGIDLQTFKYLALTIESGVLDDSNPSSDFTIQTSDDEVVQIPVPPKVPPVIDLVDESIETSDTNLLGTCDDPPISEAVPSQKPDAEKDKQPRSIKRSTPPSKKKKHHSKEKQHHINKNEHYSNKKEHHKKGHHSNEKEQHRSKVKQKLVDYSSESSTESSSHNKKKKKKTKNKRLSRSYSSSECEEDSDYEERTYNPALVKEEENLYGLYYCPTCKLSMNSEGTLQSHLNGKKHMKVVKQQDIPKAMADLLITANTVKPNRYPAPRPNVERITVHEMAFLQRAVQERVKTPCPGLENVIEIRGLEETHYYCKLCDAPCTSNTVIPHLKGRKHQLQCLNLFDVETYERIKYKNNKNDLDKILLKRLKDIERSEGAGLMMVEREIDRNREREPYSSQVERAPRREEIPGPSHRYFDQPDDTQPESFEESMLPDTSRSDFYCKICDSHMNNVNMWESHVRGKRHLKNVKKAPGEAPSKTKSYALPNARALIMAELDHVEEAVVGLKYMRETQNPEVKGAIYNCFLCGACLTQIDVIDHILTQKHRTKFLEKIKHPDMETMSKIQMPESRLGSIIEETCAEEENRNGRGRMEVHVMRNVVPRW